MSTDNTEKEKGFTYQAMYALKIFFENSNNSDFEIGYETDWDITLWNGNKPLKYYEVKHHKNKGNLTKNSKDFWKTLKNMYSDFTNKEKPTFNEYILVTTEKNKFFSNDKEKFECIKTNKNKLEGEKKLF